MDEWDDQWTTNAERTEQSGRRYTSGVHLLALEVRREWTLAVGPILERTVAIRAERTGQHADVPEHALERLVEHIRHLVLEILRRGERGGEEERAAATRVDTDLATSTANVGVLVKALPQLVDRGAGGLGADIEQDAHVGLDERPKCVEEPPMAVKLLLVLLLETE
jgi:hypothetical protein